MLALIARNQRLEMQAVPEPLPGRTDAVVQVAASSINRGEVRGIRAAPHWDLQGASNDTSWNPGWDFAGTVERPAADGTGPGAGTRVVGWARQGAWAERVAAPVAQMVVIPESVSFAEAATLPIAGLTAWHALRLGELASGKAVLVNGAAGGVGRFALQIAKAAGARAFAVVGSELRAQSISHLTNDVFFSLPNEGVFDIILECVGGPTLAKSFSLIAPYGVVVSYGNSSDEQTCFHADAGYRKPCFRLQGLNLIGELARRAAPNEGLDELVAMLAAGTLKCDIDLEVDWRDAVRACDALMARQINGKAVLRIG